MMTRIFVPTLMCLLLPVSISVAQEAGTLPEAPIILDDYQSIVDKASEVDKPIFVYAYDSV